MLETITLSHFRQHIDRTFNFGPGINAIRGEVEQGKTTVLEAFTYFCFGSQALRESLDDVVTYDCSVSKLRVDVKMTHLGVEYTGYRGKSGAEVNFGGEKVVGQREVTRFFENLYGVDAKTAGKLMFASQKSLAESLKAGPTEAGRMIEDLANFDLIDTIAETIARRRATGPTACVEGRIAALQAQITSEEPEDLAPLQLRAAGATAAVVTAEEGVAAIRTKIDALDVAGARATLQRHSVLESSLAAISAELRQVQNQLEAKPVQAPTEAALAGARRAVEDEKQIHRARDLHDRLKAADTRMLWDEPLAALEADIVKRQESRAPLVQRLSGIVTNLASLATELAAQDTNTRVAVTKLEGQLIRESTCSLCQKDLKDVPEVVRINSSITTEIDAVRAASASATAILEEKATGLKRERNLVEAQIADLDGELAALQNVQKVNNRVELVYAQAGDLITVDRAVVPGQWAWVGPDTAAGARPDVAGALAALEQQARKAAADAATRVALAAQSERLAARIVGEAKEQEGLPMDEANETIQKATDLTASLEAARAALQRLQGEANALRSELATKEALAVERERSQALTRKQLKAAEDELESMRKYNALIKKVRAARPEITNKLWNIVLTGVSKYFTDVRGVPSKITRGDGIFRCNGRPVAGLSGSAEDMLGLSMRIALTKTFLPGVDQLTLDEPAAACSDSREEKMLGMLATLQFGQIVIISHSDATDAFADQIVHV